MRDQLRDRLAGYQPERLESDDLVPAAVMILLYERGDGEHLLFQVRTQHVEHHKGEISLPGGAKDPEDETLLQTALRETEEEIGVATHHVEVFGQLDDVRTRSSFVMSPFVGAITEPGPYPFRSADIEVAELLEVPLERLLSGDALEWTQPPLGGAPLMPAFRHDEHLIFGATARVVDHFLKLLREALDAGAPAGARTAR